MGTTDRRVAILFALGGLLAGLSSCASLQEMDRSRLNHPAMDLQARRTPAASAYLTPLLSLTGQSSSGVCTTCAH